MWSIILNFRFYEKINTTKKMPYNYDLWNTWSLITVILLSFFGVIEYLVNTINNGSYKGFKSQIKVYSLVVFFTGIIVVGIQDSILNNFLVDG
jgi:phage-related holin